MERKKIKRPSVVGLTQAQKTAAIKATEAAILEEKTEWVNSGQTGYLFKQEKAGFFGGKKWKRFFFVLNVNRHELFYYEKSDSNNKPVGRQLGRWAFSIGKVKITPVKEVKDSKYVLNLTDPNTGTFQVAAESEADREMWTKAIRLVSEGFKPSEKAERALAVGFILFLVRGGMFPEQGKTKHKLISYRTPRLLSLFAPCTVAKKSMSATNLMTLTCSLFRSKPAT